MQYRVADADDIKKLLPSDIDKSYYNPDQVDLVFLVDDDTNKIRHGRAVDTYLSAYQMFNVVPFDDDSVELIPVGPWKPIAEGSDQEVRLSDCKYGCKVYRKPDGYEYVWHSATYGCPKGKRH